MSDANLNPSAITIEQAMALALQHHQAGRLAEAEVVCRRILDQQPSQARALNLLGIIASQRGQNQLAVQWIGRAIAIDPATARYHNNLGLILIAQGQSDDAIKAYREAIRLTPDYTEAHNNLGSALKQSGQLAAAIAAFQEVLRLKPDYAEAHNNLGNALQDQNQLPAAIAEYRLAIGLKPDLAEAYNNLGNVLKEQGQLDSALGAYREALRLKPDYAQAHSNLGVVLLARGQFDQAAAACREAIRLKPDFAQAHNNLGNAFKEQDQLEEAISQYRLAIGLKPDLAEAYNNLGNALKEQNKLDEAISQYRLAIGLKPDLAEAYNNLGALNDRGQIPEAIAAYRTAMQLKSNFPKAHSNLIFSMHLDSQSDAQAIHHELLRWNLQHAEPLKKFIQPHAHSDSHRDNLDRKLRVGYVSGDFREHVVGWNLLPLFKEHHRELFEIYCYTNSFRDDAVTGQLRSCTAVWRNITSVNDRHAAQMIRDDKIDILVDLALHTADNRLTLFAHKPAPVQVTWLGYPGSTGLDAIDYRFSDPYLDPPDADLTVYSEQTLRLPNTYWCYRPGGPAPEPAPPPVLHAGYVTFGCLNNFSKVSPKVMDLWAQILHRVPRSRLIVHSKPGVHLDRVRERFVYAGITADRLEFVGLQPWGQYIQTYGRIDIALDPFPYNGGITTCDSLHMGVPVVSLSGQTAVGRGGRSILSNIGLPELIAYTPQEYVDLAVKLSGDLPQLAKLRKTLRQRMQASPLMDAKCFAQNVESTYRDVWRRWCEKQK
jgi:protein O-GlcNAc transferase